jgi:hypothetical protein
LRTPSATGWLAIGATVAAAGAIPVGDQISDVLTNSRAGFFSAWCIGGLVVFSIGLATLLMGALMRDGNEEPKIAPDPLKGTKLGQRIGIRMRGRSQFNGQNARISNQDVGVDMDDDSRWNSNDPVID